MMIVMDTEIGKEMQSMVVMLTNLAMCMKPNYIKKYAVLNNINYTTVKK